MALNNMVRVKMEAPDGSAMRSLDASLLPPGVGNNWKDTAFKSTHDKPQMLQGEFAGKRVPGRRGIMGSSYAPNASGNLNQQNLAYSGGTAEGMRGLKGFGTSRREEMPHVTSKSAMDLAHTLQVSALKNTRGAIAEIQMEDREAITLDDKVLKFYAYFEEAVRESRTESNRVRKVTIQYYPSNETISITEPRIANSGLQGGLLLKRAQVPITVRQREVTPDEDFVNLNHINVGVRLKIHGTWYTIYDCDYPTRLFMEDLGMDVPMPMGLPEDNFLKSDQMRQTMTNDVSNGSLLFGIKSQDRTVEDAIRGRRFVEDSGKVLRFDGQWDERHSVGGIVHDLEVRYFIEDDTVSIKEKQATTEAVSAGFLSRRRLPKSGKNGKAAELTFAGRVNGIKETFMGTPNAYYSAEDLYVGCILNVFGREVVLISCDDYTREYYASVYGADVGEPLEGFGNVKNLNSTSFESRRPKEAFVPPPTGFGADDDSMASCKKLVLEVPRKPAPLADDGEVLRYEMKFHDPPRPEDMMRRFILNYYTDDGEVMVQEGAVKNTGFTGGRWLKKQKLRTNPDDRLSKPTFLELKDIFVGAVLTINKFHFDLIDIDQHSSNYLANKADMAAAQEEGFTEEDIPVSDERLMQVLKTLQEYLTVRFMNLTEAFRYFDDDKDGNITVPEMQQALKHSNITRKRNEALAVVQVLDRSQQGAITYNDWFAALGKQHALNVDLSIRQLDNSKCRGQTGSVSTLRAKVLKKLKERLEGRCMNGFEMFRLISTQPRAHKGRRSDIMALTNIEKDCAVTPVQLRRCVQDTLGMMLREEEMEVLLEYFFPELERSEYQRSADRTKQPMIELKDFQALFNAMVRIGTLEKH